MKKSHFIILAMMALVLSSACKKDKKAEYTLNLSILPIGSGSVTLSPLKATYEESSQVILTPNPSPGYLHNGWGGTDGSSVVNNIVVMTKNMDITVNFKLISFSIQAGIDPVGTGTVSGTGYYDYGQTVILTALPTGGSTFKNWTENGVEVSTSPIYSFIASANRTLIANFELPTKLDITITQEPSGGSQINQVKVKFSGIITGKIKPVDVTVEWWWENAAHANTAMEGTTDFTFDSGISTSKSSTFAAPYGYILLNYWWVKIIWTDDAGDHLLESDKAFCSSSSLANSKNLLIEHFTKE
jgi:hypothetical protein